MFFNHTSRINKSVQQQPYLEGVCVEELRRVVLRAREQHCPVLVEAQTVDILRVDLLKCQREGYRGGRRRRSLGGLPSASLYPPSSNFSPTEILASPSNQATPHPSCGINVRCLAAEQSTAPAQHKDTWPIVPCHNERTADSTVGKRLDGCAAFLPLQPPVDQMDPKNLVPCV